jgi:acyl-coenzyme A synthetase/AMP-(fatty) acid ligase
VEGVQLVRAFGRANPVTGQIVAVDVVLQKDADPGDVDSRIRLAAQALPAAARPRSIHFVEALELRQHKIVRSPSETTR